MKKKKIIIYGLGEIYEEQKEYLKHKYEIVGYSDTYKDLSTVYGGVNPEDIIKCSFDYIYITSFQCFEEIKNYILGFIGEGNENRILSFYDVIGDFRHSETKDLWVINQLSQIPEGQIILDAGAGEQRFKPYCSHLKYIAQDFGEYIPDEIETGLQSKHWNYNKLDLKCDLIDMPLENESVDAILCVEVFEHINNPVLAIKEFSRVLRTGGTLILTAPVCCMTHMAPFYYYNGFSEYWYKENLNNSGLIIKEFARTNNYFSHICGELSWIQYMADRYCHNKLNSEEMCLILKSMELLVDLSKKDMGSDETLCSGSMLVAEKR